MSEVLGLEKQLEDSKHLLKKREQVFRLYNNPDFKQLIVDEFCTTDCARFAQESADPCLDAGQRADALGMAQAAGHLRRYLAQIVVMGNTAERTIPDLENEIVAARQEDAEAESQAGV